MELILVVGILGMYFLPSIVGSVRKKANNGAIFALNLLLGWTVLGWVVALVWALTVEKPWAGLVQLETPNPVPDMETSPERTEFESPGVNTCRSCKGRLPSGVTRCRYCGANQKEFSVRNVAVLLVISLFGIFLVATLFGG